MKSGKQMRGVVVDDYGSAPVTLWEMQLTEEQIHTLSASASALAEGEQRRFDNSSEISGGRLLRIHLTSEKHGIVNVEYYNHLDDDVEVFLRCVDSLISPDQPNFLSE